MSFAISTLVDDGLVGLASAALAALFLTGVVSKALEGMQTQIDEDDASQADKQEVSQAAENIGNATGVLAIGSAEVSFFLEKLASDIDNSGREVAVVASSAKDMSSGINRVNELAKETAEKTEVANLACDEGTELLDRCVAGVEKLSQGVTVTSTLVENLAQKSEEIQNITAVIDSISEQTNLLALNAAIEAARAGESGRGFAVVADEVRALAKKSADATEKIDQTLRQVYADTEQARARIDDVVSETESLNTDIFSVNDSLKKINELVKFSNSSNHDISENLSRSDLAAKDISTSIAKVNQFLQEKCENTHSVAEQANNLTVSSEEVFFHLEKFKLDSLHSRMCRLAMHTAEQVSKRFEEAIENREIKKIDLFKFDYTPIENTNPQKFHTSFDRFTDKVLPTIQEPILELEKEIIFAGAVDKNGYFPTHNLCFSQPLTGNYEKDVAQNRTKRIFNDPTGSRCGSNKKRFLLQTYKRDTGEIMHDVSAPIYVNGSHWGGFRIGFRSNA